MHPNRRRKKRPNYGIRTVEVLRGLHGFGFTISGQQPCILSCIVSNSPADQAGLRAGDFLISVNGVSVSKLAHDAVVTLIGNCVGPIRMTIAENYYSDSSDEEMDCGRMVKVNSRKPKYMHKPRPHRMYNNKIEPKFKLEEVELGNVPMEDEAGPIEYKALVGYLGTIEMPKQLLPNSRLQTVCSCIRKLRQEKRQPTAVLMTVLPTCLTLKNAANHILAIYPTNRVVYIGSTIDKDSRYFGLVTSAVCDTRNNENLQKRYGELNIWQNEKFNNIDNGIEISNSCHVFVTDPKIIEHNIHAKKAEYFKITCTPDLVTGNCLEFPLNALNIVSLVQNMYKLQNSLIKPADEPNLNAVVANSPQPSASSNSDSGIGFRDDCGGNISDRILVVEFPAATNRADLPVFNNTSNADSNLDELNNKRCQQNNLSPNESTKPSKQFNNLNNIRACEGVSNIKNHLLHAENYLAKQNNDDDSRLTCRAMPLVKKSRGSSTSSDDNNAMSYMERPIDVPDDVDFKSSVDNVSIHSSKSLMNVFKAPSSVKKSKRQLKTVSSCDNLDKYHENIMIYKLSPKVFGLSKPNYSCEELNNLDSIDKYGYGSLQDLCSWNGQRNDRKTIAQSEPDVRISRKSSLCEQNGIKSNNEGPAGWATSFEKLLEDPLGLHAFAEFLKKEFSAENIYFWTACERYRCLPAGSERSTEAQRIYQQHLAVGAPEPVNVDSQGRQCTEQSLPQPETNLFDLAQKQIFNLMKFDSYPRFLKSDIYKQCLSGDLEKPQLDVGLLLQLPSSTTNSKLKKSLSNAEDRRRKSLLPWHRKNRSKSKDRGENDYNVKKEIVSESITSKSCDIHSSRSSLTSLDLAITSQDGVKTKSEELSSRVALCRVNLSNGSTTVVQIKQQAETIQELVARLLEKRGIYYSSFEVYTNKHPKPVDLGEPSTNMAGCEVSVEQRVVFKLDLPNKKIISVKSKYTKIIVDVLRPILHRYQYNLEQVVVTTASKVVDVHLPVTSIDGSRLHIELLSEYKGDHSANPVIKINNKVTHLEEITNQVFEGILQEKSDAASQMKGSKSDKGSVKSEDLCSEHSSGIFGKFLRRDSALYERKKKSLIPRSKPAPVQTNPSDDNTNNTEYNQMKKPLIAKWKAGANKLQVTCSESDELVEGLTRAQRCRLEDQRGTEINFELPDFLKDKENDRFPKTLRRPMEVESNRFYLMDRQQVQSSKIDRVPPVVASAKNLKLELQSNYENRSILFNESLTKHSSSKLGSEESSSPSKRMDVAGDAGRKESPTKNSEPPPLPPKPKIVPIKPPNWGQNGFHKPNDLVNTEPALFLEQPSSSFV